MSLAFQAAYRGDQAAVRTRALPTDGFHGRVPAHQ